MDITANMAPQVLTGKTALVTGAGQGNGRAIAKGLAKAGAKVIVTDLNEDNAKAVASEIEQSGGSAAAYRLDVTSAQQCEAVAANVGDIDILVNNAGIIIREGIDSPKVDGNLERTMAVNVMGTFRPTNAWLKALRASRGSSSTWAPLHPPRAFPMWSGIRPPRAP